MLKTSEALYGAMEAISRAQDAMCRDIDDFDTKPAGVNWLKYHYPDVSTAYKLIKQTRDSLNDEENQP